MADHTHIEWTDATWNPITGCSVVSAGCKHCYAMKLAGTRLQHHPSRAGLTVETKAGPVWNGQVRFNEEWLYQPLRWRRPRRIFVCAHGDLFHEAVPQEWIERVFEVMARARHHTFQVLTKRPERALQFFMRLSLVSAGDCLVSAAAGSWPLPNVWLGVSVEDQAAADERIPLLLRCPAAVRWVSAEPLLGSVDLTNIRWAADAPVHVNVLLRSPPALRTDLATGWVQPLIDWVVAGGESGRGARPMHPDWARSLRDQCTAAGVPFLFKQWGAWAPSTGGESARMGPDRRDPWMKKVGKKAAGRLLDGVLHDGFPEARR